MRIRRLAVIAALAAAAAFAEKPNGTATQTQGFPQPGAARELNAQMMLSQQFETQSQPGAREITARVVGQDPSAVYLESRQGKVLPLQVNNMTVVDGVRGGRAQLQQGEQVRARFDVQRDAQGQVHAVAQSVDRK